MYGVKNIKIVNFIVQETGTYDQQWKRPFVSGLNQGTFNDILNTVNNTKAITPAALTGVANQFLQPSAAPESHILIPNGWGERRLRFFLEVMTESQMGSLQTEYVVGYTDYAGMDNFSRLDPNMRFFINAVNVTRTTYQHTPLGNQVYQNVIDSSHVLVNDQYTGINNNRQMYSMRPEEIYTQMESGDMAAEVGTDDFKDARLLVTHNPIKSKRTNAIAPVYVSKILDSYLKTRMAEETGGSRIELLESARATVRSDSVQSDPFISFIRSRGDGSGNSFSFNDLIALDPTIVGREKVLSLTHTTRATVHQAGSTCNWAAANGETVFATCIAQSLPGYMLDHCINNIIIRATNNSIGSQIALTVDMVKSFMKGIDITQFVQSLCFKLENELLKDLSYNNQMGFTVEIRCDLLGETWINLSINSGPFVMYVTPSFCDALMTPITTANKGQLASIAGDFDNLLNSMGSDMFSNANTGIIGTSMGGFGQI